MTDSNRVRLSYVEESTYGTTPASPGFQTLRFTSESLASEPQTTTSQEIRSDRQVSDLILVGVNAAGDVSMEMSFSSHDALVESAMYSTFTETPKKEGATEITQVTDASDTFTVDAGGASFVADMLIYNSGFDDSANNGLFTVSSSTATTVVVAGTPTLVDDASPASTAKIKVVGFVGAANDIDADATGLTSTATDFTTFGLAVGMWVKIGGGTSATEFATSANNGWARISSISATDLNFDILPASWAAEDVSAGANAGATIQVFFGDYVRNATTEKSFTFEKAYLGNSTFEYVYGMVANQMNLQFDSQSVVTGSFSFMGTTGEYASQKSGATYADQTTTDILNTSSNVGRIGEGGSTVASPNFVRSASISLNNNLRAKTAIGQLGAFGVGSGRAEVTGSLSTYFGDTTLLAKVINNTATSFDIRVKDSDNQVVLIDLPQVKYTSGSTPVGGIDQDVMADLGYQAYRHATLGYTIHYQKFDYVPA